MIGLRHNLTVGLRHGESNTLAADAYRNADSSALDPMRLVTRDATSLKYVPASAAEWNLAITTAGIASGSTPSSLWLLQEPSGNPADSIGALTLTAVGVSYGTSVAGWARKAITSADGTTNRLTNASLPDIATNSTLIMLYARTPASAPGTARNIVMLGANATRAAAEVSTDPKLTGRCVGNTALGTDPAGAVRPIIVQVDRTAGSVLVYSDADKLVPTFDASCAGTAVAIGRDATSGALLAPDDDYLYAALFTGAAAEMSSAAIKALLIVLGWTVGW